jgi:hypothetical protein
LKENKVYAATGETPVESSASKKNNQIKSKKNSFRQL